MECTKSTESRSTLVSVPEVSDSKPCTAGKGWLHRFRNRLEPKNTKIARKANFIDEEPASIFLAELKKLIEKKWIPSSCNKFELCWRNGSAKEALGHKTWK